MRKNNAWTSTDTGMLILTILILSGWIKNIDKLSDCNFEAPYKCEVIHTIGLIPPIGAVIGWMDFGR